MGPCESLLLTTVAAMSVTIDIQAVKGKDRLLGEIILKWESE
jgi:hypothetical protein